MHITQKKKAVIVMFIQAHYTLSTSHLIRKISQLCIVECPSYEKNAPEYLSMLEIELMFQSKDENCQLIEYVHYNPLINVKYK